MITKDGQFYDVVCDKEEDVVGNYRIICSKCKEDIMLIMSLTYNKEHSKSRVELCPNCKKLNLIWDKTFGYINSNLKKNI